MANKVDLDPFYAFWTEDLRVSIGNGMDFVNLELPIGNSIGSLHPHFSLVPTEATTIAQVQQLQPVLAGLPRRRRMHVTLYFTKQLQPGVADAILLALGAIPTLVALHLNVIVCNDNLIASLAAFLPTLPSLEIVDYVRYLVAPATTSLDPLIRSFPLCPQLRVLYFYVKEFREDELAAMVEILPRCRQLAKLCCRNYSNPQQRADIYQILPACRSLRALALQPCAIDCTINGIPTAQWVLARLFRLTAIGFIDWGLQDWHVDCLESFLNSPDIKSVYFLDCKFSTRYLGTQPLADQFWHLLRRPQLFRQLYGTPQPGLLSYLPTMPSLQELYFLKCVPVEGDLFMARICAMLPCCRNLTTIAFQKTADSIAALPVLAAVLPQIPKLRRILLYNYYGTTTNVDDLVVALPQCRNLRQLTLNNIGDMSRTIAEIGNIVPSCRLLHHTNLVSNIPRGSPQRATMLGIMTTFVKIEARARTAHIHEAIFTLLLCLKREIGLDCFMPVELLLIMMENYFEN